MRVCACVPARHPVDEVFSRHYLDDSMEWHMLATRIPVNSFSREILCIAQVLIDVNCIYDTVNVHLYCYLWIGSLLCLTNFKLLWHSFFDPLEFIYAAPCHRQWAERNRDASAMCIDSCECRSEQTTWIWHVLRTHATHICAVSINRHATHSLPCTHAMCQSTSFRHTKRACCHSIGLGVERLFLHIFFAIFSLGRMVTCERRGWTSHIRQNTRPQADCIHRTRSANDSLSNPFPIWLICISDVRTHQTLTT